MSYTIRRMQADEVKLAVDWAEKEGWNPGLNDAKMFFAADPQGFFIGLLDDEPIAVGSAVVYDNIFAFCGLYIVKKEFRGQGFGLKLTEERLKYTGNRITGIDGVLEKVSVYERIGYVASHKQIRYALKDVNGFSLSPDVVDLKAIPLKQVEAFDAKYFQAKRAPFLEEWIHQPHSFAFGFLEEGELKGYGVIRKCVSGYKIGPLFADTPLIAHTLFESLVSKAEEGPIYLDIPEPNKNAQALVKHYKMNPSFEVIRMYRNGFPKVNLEEGIYGITTFELG